MTFYKVSATNRPQEIIGAQTPAEAARIYAAHNAPFQQVVRVEHLSGEITELRAENMRFETWPGARSRHDDSNH